MNSRASSPIVMPWRIGIGNWPTNDAYAGSSVGALDRVAADRIRPIADDDADAVPARGAQAVGHRVDVGVDARADILEIDDEHVDVGEHLARSARASRCRASSTGTRRLASVACGDSIMFSCRSERNPCCGPKIAVSVQSPGDARRSAAWRIAASIEPGLQTRPMRWPAIRLRSGPSSRRSRSEATGIGGL